MKPLIMDSEIEHFFGLKEANRDEEFDCLGMEASFPGLVDMYDCAMTKPTFSVLVEAVLWADYCWFEYNRWDETE